jgi:predicted Zn-dependent protease
MDTFHSRFWTATARHLHHWTAATAVVAALSFLPSGFAASEPSLITGEKESFGYSWQEELKLGAETDKEITQQMGLYNDAELQSYVAAVGQRLVQQSDFNRPNAPEMYRNTNFTFRVIDSPVVNAFAVPGGFVYVTRGLLSHVQNEAQLAVVLGHEIAHVAARHSSQQARRSKWTQLGVIAGAILGSTVLGEKGADLAPTLLNLGGQAAELFLLRYSREAEHESDNLGVNYAVRAGYAADQSARFFQSLQRLGEADGKTLPTWKSSHPDPGDRAERVVSIASQVPPETRTNVGEEQFLKHIENIVVGEDPRQGFAQNGVFYHPALRFQMPVAEGWTLDNQPSAVVMSQPNGNAMMGLRLAAGTRARDAAMQFAQESKVKIVTSGDTVVNGLPTTVIIGQAETEQGVVSVWNAFIEFDGKVYSLLGYAPQPSFEQVRPTFESVAAGFSPLRDQNVTSVQPARLKLVRADRTAPFAAFIPTALPRDMTADELSVLNQVTLNDTINEGRILKIPEVPPQPNIASAGTPAAVNQRYPATNQPQQGYPQTTYPPASPSNYPSQASTYPQQTQPQYPQQQQPYPPQNYPQQTYPQQPGQPQNYPQTTTTYPPAQYPPSQTTYPPQPRTYPQQPASTYPQPSPYPQQPATTYPQQQSGTTYPQQGYPANPTQAGANYPAQPSYPQFPQPPSAGQNRTTAPQTHPQTQSSGPVWPR